LKRALPIWAKCHAYRSDLLEEINLRFYVYVCIARICMSFETAGLPSLEVTDSNYVSKWLHSMVRAL
jgi:hypothetical protein